MTGPEPAIRDLAVIGDRRTAAIVTRDGAIVWYCPGRFDKPSLFAALLDPDRGGAWKIGLPAGAGRGRRYIEESGVLETRLQTAGGELTVTDWMSLGEVAPRGICRLFSRAPEPVSVSVSPAPDYARAAVDLRHEGNGVRINSHHWLYASHPLAVEQGSIRFEVPPGAEAWAVLADAPIENADSSHLRKWLATTLAEWREIASHIAYEGPFERELAQSLRALRLLTYGANGGIIAAATTSLPEVPGGDRNYDYRYVWLRDTGMIASALVRAGSDGPDAPMFLDFICGSRQPDPAAPLLPPFLSLDFTAAPDEFQLDLRGYAGSRPIRIGNNANDQLQLDGFANVLLAAKLIYRQYGTREHWSTVRDIADFLAAHWQEPDYGIWEEHRAQQYTTGKVISSCALRYIADCAEDEQQARRWRSAAGKIDDFVKDRCMNAEGAYAAIAGGEAVDVSAVLFPIWGYTEADSPAMLATMRVLDREYSDGHLYWRHLDELDPYREGAFLAGTIWVAQYWVMRKDLERAHQVLQAALVYANDLGFFAEEGDPQSNTMLGNFPQTFVHAAFVGAVIDYKKALES